MNVFIVDDSMVITTVLKGNLENSSEDLNVMVYEKVTDALSSNENPDVIILDHFLEKTNGIDALPVFKTKFPKAKIILLSGQTDVTKMEQAYENGADLYFFKGNEALLDVVDAVKEMEDEFKHPSTLKKMFGSLKKAFSRSSSKREKKLIFILEESDSFVRKLKSEIESKLNADVELFKDIKECEKCLDQKPDIIITDYKLPGRETALDFIPRVQKLSPDTKTYVLSAQKNVEIASRLMKENVEKYYVKSPRSIERIVNELA